MNPKLTKEQEQALKIMAKFPEWKPVKATVPDAAEQNKKIDKVN